MLVESRGLPSNSTCVLKAEPGKLLIKDANLVFYLSVYKLVHSSNLSDYDVNIVFGVDSKVIDDVMQKVQRRDDLIKTHVAKYATFIKSACNNAVLK